MCGRYAFIKTNPNELKERFKLTKAPKQLKPRYNIAPSQDVPVILNESSKEISMARWGLIPNWAKEENTQYSMINAKAETITQKPAYRGPIKRKRCLIIADSFYEWQRTGNRKSPYRIMLKDEGLFAFAGIWDCWNKSGPGIYSCSIITTAADGPIKDIHERMPVILPEEKEKMWLSDIEIDDVLSLLKPYDEKRMAAYEISTLVNSPKNNTADVFAPV